jgi:ribosome recycling factor
MTKEYRESLVKKAKEMGESAKQSIRRARQKGIAAAVTCGLANGDGADCCEGCRVGMDAVKKISKAISKDDAKRFEKDVCEMYVKVCIAVRSQYRMALSCRRTAYGLSAFCILPPQVQDHHDKHIKTVDDLVQRKAKAIME